MDFKENVAMSFRKVKNDFEAIKQNVQDWIFSINKRQAFLEHKVQEMEERLAYLERVESQKMGWKK